MLQVKLFNHKCRFEVHKLLFKDVSLKNHLPKVNFLCRQDKNALELISFLSLIRLRYQKERERSVCMCMCTACVCMWWGSRSVCVVCPISLAYMLCNFCWICSLINNVNFITTILNYPFITEANALQQLLLVLLMLKNSKVYNSALFISFFITGYVGLDLQSRESFQLPKTHISFHDQCVWQVRYHRNTSKWYRHG